MKKVLVAYYSKTGTTEKVAKDLALGLNADLEVLIDKKNRKGILGFIFGGRDAIKKRFTEIGNIKNNPADYDLVVLGTPVWAENISPAVRTYIDQNKSSIKEVAYFFTSGDAPLEKIMSYFTEASGKNGIASLGFNSSEIRNGRLREEKIQKFISEIKTELSD